MSRRRATVGRASRLHGVLRVPGDKSLSHRAVLFTAALGGETRVEGLSDGGDVAGSLEAVRRLGSEVESQGDFLRIRASGSAAGDVSIDCGNSGTTARLLLGITAGLPGLRTTLSGDASLSRRPMRRVTEPLARMGASVVTSDAGALPAVVEGRALTGRRHVLPVASAQVKSALLLAGVAASGETWVREPIPSRDHTERWLPAFGVEVRRGPDGVGVSGGRPAFARRTLRIPGDPSSAAFFAVAAALVPGARVVLEGLSLNPTRLGAFDVLREAGARVEVVSRVDADEPYGTVEVSADGVRAFSVSAERVPALVDELPVLAVLAACAPGVSRVRGAGELRVKESDRLAAIVRGLRAMGAEVQEFPDGFDVAGGRPLVGAHVDAGLDHRIAMAFTVAGLVSGGETVIDGAEWVATSYPGFFEALARLGADVRLEPVAD